MELNSRLFFLLRASMSVAWREDRTASSGTTVTARSKRELDLETHIASFGNFFRRITETSYGQN
jgi:hypothetical protein